MFHNHSLYFNYDDNNEDEEITYPDFFYKWDNDFDAGISPGFYESDEICEIIEIYLEESEYFKAQKAIDYALKVYPDDEDLFDDILGMLCDFERWNEALAMSEKFEILTTPWIDSNHVKALLHLGMEEDAFLLFGMMKKRYIENNSDLSLIYEEMGESLFEVNLYQASINVVNEAIERLGDDINFRWLMIHSYLQMDNKEKVIELGEIIAKMDPFECTTWHRLGVIYKDAGEFPRAVDAFEFAQTQGIKDKENLIQLIDSYEYNGNYRRALEYAIEYIKLFPNNYLINFVASTICSHMEMWDEAVNFLDNAIRIEPSMDSLYLCKSNYLLNLGEQRKAKQTLLEGIERTEDPEADLKTELERLNDLYPNV